MKEIKTVLPQITKNLYNDSISSSFSAVEGTLHSVYQVLKTLNTLPERARIAEKEALDDAIRNLAETVKFFVNFVQGDEEVQLFARITDLKDRLRTLPISTGVYIFR